MFIFCKEKWHNRFEARLGADFIQLLLRFTLQTKEQQKSLKSVHVEKSLSQKDQMGVDKNKNNNKPMWHNI